MFNIGNYYRATSIDDAYQVLQKNKTNVILGGMMWLRQSTKNVHTAIDLMDLGLEYIKEEEGFVYIGAMATLSDLEQSKILKKYYGNLFEDMTFHIVGTQFRNTATVGGSLYGRYGFSDILTGFLPLNSIIKTAKYGEILLEEFCDKHYEKDVVEYIKIPAKQTPVCYKTLRKQSTDLPIITVCVASENKIAVGARPKKATLVTSVQEALALSYGGNMRGSAEYRQAMAKVLIEECLEMLK